MGGVALGEKIKAGSNVQEIVDFWFSSLRLPHKWRWLGELAGAYVISIKGFAFEQLLAPALNRGNDLQGQHLDFADEVFERIERHRRVWHTH